MPHDTPRVTPAVLFGWWMGGHVWSLKAWELILFVEISPLWPKMTDDKNLFAWAPEMMSKTQQMQKVPPPLSDRKRWVSAGAGVHSLQKYGRELRQKGREALDDKIKPGFAPQTHFSLVHWVTFECMGSKKQQQNLTKAKLQTFLKYRNFQHFSVEKKCLPGKCH